MECLIETEQKMLGLFIDQRIGESGFLVSEFLDIFWGSFHASSEPLIDVYLMGK